MDNIEKIHKTILQVITTGNTVVTGCTGMCEYYTKYGAKYSKFGDTDVILTPDLNVLYNIKILLTSKSIDWGFFDAIEINDELWLQGQLPVG